VHVEVDLPLAIDRSNGVDLRQQLAAELRRAVLDRRLLPGQRLPSSRALAAQLRLARATVTAALAELEGEGWVEARQGAGTWVSSELAGLVPTQDPRSGRPRRPSPAAPLVDLVPGHPDTSSLADAAWRRAWREAVAASSAYDPPLAGLPTLRTALADHVRRTRGVLCDANDVVVTAGTADALRLLADAVGVAGRVAALEDPGYPAARTVLQRSGATIAGVAVDHDGLVVEALPARAALLHVTPSHQYPLGGSLPVERRAALLKWATSTGALIVEDDYDGEFRFGVNPLPALAALDRGGHVAYVGTLSKVASPALRLGYVIAGPGVVAACLSVRADTGTPVAGLLQDAVARYVLDGGLRRHVARQRRLYAERRTRLLRRLTDVPGVLGVRGLDAGLHAVVTLSVPAGPVVAALLERGVLVADLDDYRIAPGPSGVVIGYGHVPPASLDQGLDALKQVLADADT
jgi:GntR family transcriptional regulator/MocR family aminotransferase